MAAAIGCGLPVQEPTGNMIVDIGGGTTEVAVISLGGIVTHRSVRVGGDELDEAIVQHVRRTYNLLIGERTAEEIKQTIGSVYPVEGRRRWRCAGRDLVTGLPKTVTLERGRNAGGHGGADRRHRGRGADDAGADAARAGRGHDGQRHHAGRRRQPDAGLDRLLMEETGMPVHVAEDPLTAVVRGTGTALEHFDLLRRVAITSRKASG